MKTPWRVVPLPLLALAASSACSSAAHSGSSGSAVSAQKDVQGAPVVAAPCTAAVRGVDVSSWQVVAAKGFTFCLPPGWQGRGDTRRQGRTSLSWGTGTPPRQRVVVVTRELVRAGERPMPPEPPPGSDVRRFTEQIDGRTATLWRNRFERTYYIGAQWDAPSVWITAESLDSDAADLVLNVARTVRFVSK